LAFSKITMLPFVVVQAENVKMIAINRVLRQTFSHRLEYSDRSDVPGAAFLPRGMLLLL